MATLGTRLLCTQRSSSKGVGHGSNHVGSSRIKDSVLVWLAADWVRILVQMMGPQFLDLLLCSET